MNLVNRVLLNGKRVLVRADLDVVVQDGQITDDFRLHAILPTFRLLLESQARQIIILGHLDRPRGYESQQSLAPIAQYLGQLLSTPIQFIPYQTDFKQVVTKVNQTTERVLLVENLKFWPGEADNDLNFAQYLAQMGDMYVNESFATSHHEYASMVSLPPLLPSCAGLRLAEEIQQLQNFWTDSERPIIFLLGGAKSDKINPIYRMIAQADLTLVGGAFVFNRQMEKNAKTIWATDHIQQKDIGPQSIELFKSHLRQARTVVWNGPLGQFEKPEFETGTREIALFLAQQIKENHLRVVVGGGNTISALRQFRVLDKMSFVSTGGGAMLELLAQGTLPAIRYLYDQ